MDHNDLADHSLVFHRSHEGVVDYSEEDNLCLEDGSAFDLLSLVEDNPL